MAWPFLTDILRRKRRRSGPSAPIPRRQAPPAGHQPGVPRENKPTPAGMKQSHSPHSPRLPLPSPALSAFSRPTVSLPTCPARLPYDLVADKTRGPRGAQPPVPALPPHTNCINTAPLSSARQAGRQWAACVSGAWLQPITQRLSVFVNHALSKQAAGVGGKAISTAA
ncbi:unnamed protein product [Pleuronectes platessa]|uniref:Uncharacterized protein n=1 Tax=Pleuronectes platessa TaxID=8262 RepID=A0A9N7UBT9_PLEPL|nr:unnamed protein product [Pleuronectes platessa]